MRAIVFIILQITWMTISQLKLGNIREYSDLVLAGNIQLHDALRPIAPDQKDLMDYKHGYAVP